MSRWHAHVRIEHRGDYAEYNDTIDVASIDGSDPTAHDIEAEVMRMLINHSPQMKGGRVTRREIRRLK
jgi:hypothetical protein